MVPTQIACLWRAQASQGTQTRKPRVYCRHARTSGQAAPLSDERSLPGCAAHLARTRALSESASVTASAPAAASCTRVTTPARNATPAALHRSSSSPRSRRRHTLRKRHAKGC